jgi:methionine sulfoxide reductase heme-binding subunit
MHAGPPARPGLDGGDSGTERPRPGGGAGAIGPRINRGLMHPAVKPLLFAVLLLPLAWLVWGAATDALGANPAETLIRATGDWTLRGLCLTLAVTPLRQLSGWTALLRLRRMLGVFTFFYGSLHFLCYAWLDMGLVPADIVRDIVKRPFILVGSTALLLMLPLAATSFDRAVRTLGGARWRALHRAVYAVALLALLHFLWKRSGKNDYAEVAVYGAIMGGLLGWRLWRRWSAHRTG